VNKGIIVQLVPIANEVLHIEVLNEHTYERRWRIMEMPVYPLPKVGDLIYWDMVTGMTKLVREGVYAGTQMGKSITGNKHPLTRSK